MDDTHPVTGLAPAGLPLAVGRPADDLPGPAASAATRYLCVGAHVDPEFTDRVIRDVLEEEHRALCPSHGIDLVPIARHCLAARRRWLGRDLAILAVVAVGLFVSPLPTAVLTTAAWYWWLVYRLVKGWGARSTPKNLLLLLVLVASFYLVPPLLAHTLRQALDTTQLDVKRGLLAFLLLPVGVWAVVLIEVAQTRDFLVKRLTRHAYDPGDAPVGGGPAVQQRLQRLEREQYGNATVYSSYVPFVGSGAPFDSWSFVIDLQRRSSRASADDGDGASPTPPLIRVADLQARVVERLARLGDADLHGGDRLTGLQLKRHVFVNGRAIRGSRLFLPDASGAPRLRLGDEDVERLAHDPTGPARQYLEVRIGSWEEELVVTVHLHFATTGRTLYLEAVDCVLPPIAAAYHVVDAMPSQMTPGALLDLVTTATRTFFPVFCRVPVELAAVAFAPVRRWIEREKTLTAIRENLGFDYGAQTSVRELGAGRGYHNYFQGLDVEKYRKLVDLHVLQAVLDYLEEKGVDTSAFREQRQQILNHGIYMESGSTLNAGAVAVGRQAAARQTTQPPKA